MLRIIILPKDDAEEWRPHGETELSLEIKAAWEKMKGTDAYHEALEILQLHEGSCFCDYPINRPELVDIIGEKIGCIFDIDSLCKKKDPNLCKECEDRLPESIRIYESPRLVAYISEKGDFYDIPSKMNKLPKKNFFPIMLEDQSIIQIYLHTLLLRYLEYKRAKLKDYISSLPNSYDIIEHLESSMISKRNRGSLC